MSRTTGDTGDTGALLRRLAVGFGDAARSGRDDDLWAVQSAAEQAWRDGVRHGDLALLLVQLHLDCHSLEPAAQLLAAVPRAATTPSGQMLGAGLLLQRGEPAAAGVILLDLLRDEPTWRNLALLAAVYEEVADPAAADLLYAEAGEALDAKQLGALAWVECQRARLRLQAGRFEGADRHLRRAQYAAPGWRVSATRARWHQAVGDPAAGATLADSVAETTGRPDHAQAAAAAWQSLDQAEDVARWRARAERGFAAAAGRWPNRYAHHLVDWQLEVAQDPVAAVQVARLDYRQRPARQPAARLAAALRAAGDPQAAQQLERKQEARLLQARAELAAAVERSNAAA